MNRLLILYDNYCRMESRYLLILTENLSVLSIIMDEFSTHNPQPEVVFGSKFRDDVTYTQVGSMLYLVRIYNFLLHKSGSGMVPLCLLVSVYISYQSLSQYIRITLLLIQLVSHASTHQNLKYICRCVTTSTE